MTAAMPFNAKAQANYTISEMLVLSFVVVTVVVAVFCLFVSFVLSVLFCYCCVYVWMRCARYLSHFNIPYFAFVWGDKHNELLENPVCATNLFICLPFGVCNSFSLCRFFFLLLLAFFRSNGLILFYFGLFVFYSFGYTLGSRLLLPYM